MDEIPIRNNSSRNFDMTNFPTSGGTFSPKFSTCSKFRHVEKVTRTSPMSPVSQHNKGQTKHSHSHMMSHSQNTTVSNHDPYCTTSCGELTSFELDELRNAMVRARMQNSQSRRRAQRTFSGACSETAKHRPIHQ